MFLMFLSPARGRGEERGHRRLSEQALKSFCIAQRGGLGLEATCDIKTPSHREAPNADHR